jgi:hypothetical protein
MSLASRRNHILRIVQPLVLWIGCSQAKLLCVEFFGQELIGSTAVSPVSRYDAKSLLSTPTHPQGGFVNLGVALQDAQALSLVHSLHYKLSRSQSPRIWQLDRYLR